MSRTSRVVLVLSVLVLLAGVPGGLTGSAAAAGGSCSFPVTKTDGTGTQVTVSSEPSKIVALGPSAAQTLWEIGGKSKVTAVTTHADYLSGTGSLPKISTYPSLDTEAVVNETPDLVIAANVIYDDDVETLRNSGLTVYHAREATTIEDVYSKTLAIGQLSGECSGAKSTVSWMRAEISTAREAVRDREHPRTFYHMGSQWTAGSGTFITEILETAGATNIAVQEGISGYKVMNAERIVARDPAWIVRGEASYLAIPTSELPWSATTAVKEDQIVIVNSNYISQPAPRIVYGIETIVEALHPDVDIDVGSSGPTADLTERTPTVSQSEKSSGGVIFSVSDLYDQRTVHLEAATDTADRDAGVVVSGLTLHLAKPNPTFELTVAPTSDLPGHSPGEKGTVVLGAFSVHGNGLLGADVDRAEFRFTVPREDLVETGAGPDAVSLYRHTDGGWTRLETTLVDQEHSRFTFTATSPGTSVFAVGAPRQSSRVTAAEISDRRLQVGESITATATVHNPGITAVTVPVSLAVGGEVLTTQSVDIPANGSATVELSAPVATAGSHEVSIGSYGGGTITVLPPETMSSESPTTDVPTDTTPAAGQPSPTGAEVTQSSQRVVQERGQAGFGPVMVLFALLTFALVLSRRREGRW